MTKKTKNDSFYTKMKDLQDDLGDEDNFFSANYKGNTRPVVKATKTKKTNSVAKDEDRDWFEEENYDGQLSVDVFQTPKNIIIKSTIAGVKTEGIDIAINNDMITVRGIRRFDEEVAEEDYFYRECYWGGFSRSIILPMDIKPDKVTAAMENGILTITLPKASKQRARKIRVKEISKD